MQKPSPDTLTDTLVSDDLHGQYFLHKSTKIDVSKQPAT